MKYLVPMVRLPVTCCLVCPSVLTSATVALVHFVGGHCRGGARVALMRWCYFFFVVVVDLFLHTCIVPSVSSAGGWRFLCHGLPIYRYLMYIKEFIFLRGKFIISKTGNYHYITFILQCFLCNP